MNRQRIPNKMILGVAGVSLLLLGAFPQILWASHGDRLINGIISDMGAGICQAVTWQAPSARHLSGPQAARTSPGLLQSEIPSATIARTPSSAVESFLQE